MNVILKCRDQFGPNGPQKGDLGVIPSEAVWVDDENWYRVLFKGHEGYYFLPERMLEFVNG